MPFRALHAVAIPAAQDEQDAGMAIPPPRGADAALDLLVDEAELEPLQRINRKTVVTLVVLAGATWFLLPQFADLPEIFDQVRDANWAWLPAVLAAASVTYLGATEDSTDECGCRTHISANE